jgi:hypothetical protein
VTGGNAARAELRRTVEVSAPNRRVDQLIGFILLVFAGCLQAALIAARGQRSAQFNFMGMCFARLAQPSMYDLRVRAMRLAPNRGSAADGLYQTRTPFSTGGPMPELPRYPPRLSGTTAQDGPAPDLIQPLVGFRQWHLHGDRLYSPLRQVVWDDAVMHASCQSCAHDRDQIPGHECACGIYAYYEQVPRSASATHNLVAGTVVLWGTVELHGGGMRGSHARIVALMLPPTHGPKRRGLIAAAAYLEVPVVPFRKLKAVAADNGSAAPKTLRPPRTPLPWEPAMGSR